MHQSLNESDQFFRLGPKALIAAVCRCLAVLAMFCLSGMCFHFGLPQVGISLDLDKVLVVLTVLVTFVWFLVLTVVGHFFRSYKLDENCLHSREGVIWYRHTAVPLSRVQHAEVVRGPIERIVRLATLTVHTAGPTFYAVSVKYLDLDLANQMLKKIVPQGLDQGKNVSETE